jgi:hypothetical protein
MPEPTSTVGAGISLAALSIALLGPLAGPYALILFAALSGSLWPLSVAETGSRMAGAWLVVRCTLTSLLLTGTAVAWLQSQYGIEVNASIAPVAFFGGALGNGWRVVLDKLSGVVASIAGGLGEKK